MADDPLTMAQLDLFGAERLIEPVPARTIAPRLAACGGLPLMLMRSGEDHTAWRGPGVWCHLRYSEPRRVRGIDATGNRSSAVPAVIENCIASVFGWYPSVGAAERDALARHHGPVTRSLPEVRPSRPGLFVWTRAKAWALGVAGYTVDIWDNGNAVLIITDDATAAIVKVEPWKERPQVGQAVSLHWLGDSFDELLRRRGLDPAD